MSTIYFLQSKKYESLELISKKHSIIPINSLQLLGVPKGSIVFTYDGSLLRTITDQGHKVIYNPRNSLSPSVIVDLAQLEYVRNVQYVGSELVKEYLNVFLSPLVSKWSTKFTWYDRDENVGKVINKTLAKSVDYDLMLVTQSNINPSEYAKFLNDQDRNSKIVVVLHPGVTQDHIDQIFITLDGSTTVNLGPITRVSTGLRGHIDFVTSRDYSKFLGSANVTVVAPGQVSSELQLLYKKNRSNLDLVRAPRFILQNTNSKLSSDLADKFVRNKTTNVSLDPYYDPVLDHYNLSGPPEDHSKPYQDLLEEIINYYT